MSTTSFSEMDLQAGPFFQGYRGLNGFDEMVDSGGNLREHWQTFAQSLQNLGHEEFRHRWQEAKDLIRENGVTYNVYGDPRGLDRPWQLDPLPVLIDSKEANTLEAGLIPAFAVCSKPSSPIFMALNKYSKVAWSRRSWFSPILGFCDRVMVYACRVIATFTWSPWTWDAVRTAKSA